MMTGFFELQSVPLKSDTRVRDIYFKLGNSDTLPEISEDRLSIRLPRDAELDLNTYFGSFFEDYWHQFTPVRDVFFSFTLTGSALVRLMRFSPDTDTIVLSETVFAGDQHFCSIEVAKPGPTPPSRGRLYAIITSMSDGATITDIAWRTTLPPVRKVKIEASLCTIKREKLLSDLLAELSHLQKSKAIEVVTVINHDAPGLRERLAKYLPPHAADIDINIIDQDGVGSAGGGARGMIEALDRGTCNYYLRLDDDIQIDHMIMRRLPLLLGYLHEHIAIGSFIFSAANPQKNFTICTRMGPDTFSMIGTRFLDDLVSEGALNLYAQVEFCEYTAWWCTAMATQDIEKTGLPLPFFLYYDDIEYALHMRQNDVQSLYWPGLAIWHDPLNFKRNPFVKYYETRNFLFMMEHHRLFNKKKALKHLRGIFSNHLQQFYYAHAFALVKGIEDFLEGGRPVLENWNYASDKAIRAEIDTWEEAPDLPLSTPVTLMQKTGKPPAFKWMETPASLFRILSDIIRPVDKNAPLRSLDYNKGWNTWAASTHDYIAVTHERMNVYHVYRRNPRKVMKLFLRFCKIWLRFQFSNVGCRDQADLNMLSSQAYWRKIFKKPVLSSQSVAGPPSSEKSKAA